MNTSAKPEPDVLQESGDSLLGVSGGDTEADIFKSFQLFAPTLLAQDSRRGRRGIGFALVRQLVELHLRHSARPNIQMKYTHSI